MQQYGNMENLDPQVKNLVSAIGRAETGDPTPESYTKKGASGEFGRYQFMPETYKNYAQKYLGDANAEPSIENQNKIAYSFVKEKKDSGYNPAQIASMWNAGEGKPNAYAEGHKGINDKGVAYDTPAYTQKVSQYYNELKSVQNEQSNPPLKPLETPTPEEPTLIGSAIRGIVKPVAEFGTNLINSGQALAGDKITKPFSGKFLGDVNGLGAIDITKAPWEKNNLKTVKKAGGVGLEIGSMLGGGGGTKKIAEQGFKGFLKNATITGAKTGAISGGAGGFGQGLAENKPLGQSIIQGLGGTISGGLLGAGAGILGGLGAKGLGKIVGAPNQKAEQEAFQAIQEKITPKLTTKEMRIATKEGRVIPGKKPGIFTSGTSESVVPKEQTTRAINTIIKEIPDSPKMNNQELYGSIDDKVAEIAQNLQGEMKKVKLDTSLVANLSDNWQSLKNTQFENAPASLEKDVVKWQKQFEEFLKKSKSETLDDLWETSKKYDMSVPETVKKASSMSSDLLRMQRQIWLQNREILKKAINDTGLGLGETSKKAFLDMTDLYNSQQGILSNVKGVTLPKPSKIMQIAKKHPIITGAVGGLIGASGVGGAYKTAKELGVPIP